MGVGKGHNASLHMTDLQIGVLLMFMTGAGEHESMTEPMRKKLYGHVKLLVDQLPLELRSIP